ncbi:MAG: protein-L-isoaspartate O-methyltransferase [Pseudomonadota bacterium]
MDTDFARRQMVDQQARAWDVLDPTVLDVLATVRREDFVPDAYRAMAFADVEIPIGHGESMMTPTYEGRLLQALLPTAGDRVLEIGTGSGFVTACLASLAESVVSIDIYDDFTSRAAARLIDRRNVQLDTRDATASLPEGCFDAIAVTGSIEAFDTRLVEALAPGGRLFVVIGKAPAMEARRVTRTGDNDWRSEALFETSLKPLVHGAPPAKFWF